MAQHFLLSTKARTLSLAQVLRLSDQEAYDAFKAIRFADNGGEAVLPQVRLARTCTICPRRNMWRCKGLRPASSRLRPAPSLPAASFRSGDILAAIAIFTNGAKGHSRPATQPRPGRAIQDRLRPGAQTARGPGRLRTRARKAVGRSGS